MSPKHVLAGVVLLSAGLVLLAALWEWAADPAWSQWTFLWIAWQAPSFALIAACVGVGRVPISDGGAVITGTALVLTAVYVLVVLTADPFAYVVLGPLPLIMLAAVSGALALAVRDPEYED